MKSRLLAVAVALALSSGVLSAQSVVSISGIDRSTVPTLGTVTITGTGFDAANAAIAVIVSTRGAATVTVPVYFANATSVKFAMPPLVELATGRLFDVAVTVDLQVVQVSLASVNSSNVRGGIIVEPAPTTTAAAGLVTKAYAQMTKELQAGLRTSLASNARYAKVVDKSRALEGELQTMIDVATAIAATPERAMTVNTTNGDPLVVTREALQVSDRVALAIINQISATLTAAGVADVEVGKAVIGPLARDCRTGIPEIDRSSDFCKVSGYYEAPYADKVAPLLPTVAAFTYGIPLALVGGQAAAGIGAAGLVSEGAATGLGYAVGPAVSYSTSYAAGAPAPSVGSTFTDIGLSALDNFAFLGLPVTSGVNAGFQLMAETEQATNQQGASATVPKGAILAAPPQAVPANGKPVIAYQGIGIGATAKWLAVAATQQVTAFTTATLPPLSAARFNGLYSGFSRATCTVTVPDGPPIVQSAGGALAMTVSNGVLTVTAGGSGSTSVSPAGQIKVPTVDGCTTGGRFWEDGTGRAGATGFTSCVGAGFTCGGTWNVLRP